MNRLIDRARDAAWMLAECVVINEIAVDRSLVPPGLGGLGLSEGEIGRVIASGSMTMPTDMMLGLAGLLNDLQVMVEDEFGQSLVELVFPFQQKQAEACASALALGFQMVNVSYLSYDLLKKALAVNEKLGEVVRTNECLCEQLVKLKAENEELQAQIRMAGHS